MHHRGSTMECEPGVVVGDGEGIKMGMEIRVKPALMESPGIGAYYDQLPAPAVHITDLAV